MKVTKRSRGKVELGDEEIEIRAGGRERLKLKTLEAMSFSIGVPNESQALGLIIYKTQSCP